MLSVDGDAELLMQLWRTESELDGKYSGSWYHCILIRIYHWKWEGVVQWLCAK